MICLRKLPHLKIYSIFAFLFFSFFFAFGISQDSYATSITCNIPNFTSSSTSKYSKVVLSDICDISSLSSDTDYLLNLTGSVSTSAFTLNSGTAYAHYSISVNNINFLSYDYNFNFPFPVFAERYYVSSSRNQPAYSANIDSTIVLNSSLISNFFFLTYQGVTPSFTFSDFVLTISDVGSGSEPEPCPVCPVIPDNPYDNKFDAITKAIYTCGAVLIMLYFFFCIYKIIVKDGGSR